MSELVPNKSKPGEFRKRTLADVKKENGIPSVSVYLDTVSKPGLLTYQLDQVIEAMLRHESTPRWVSPTAPRDPVLFASYKAEVLSMAEEHKNRASENGTKVHTRIQRTIEGKPLPEIEPELAVTADAMYRECPVELTGAQTEATFVRLDLGYAGTPDIVAEGCIVDWKTQGKPGKKMEKRDTWGMQLAAYAFGVLRRPCTAYIVCGSTVAPGEVKVWKYTGDEISKEYQRFDLIRRYWQATKDFNNTDAAVAA
jgi:hypothetical protein